MLVHFNSLCSLGPQAQMPILRGFRTRLWLVSHVRTTFWCYLWSILIYFWTVARQHKNFFLNWMVESNRPTKAQNLAWNLLPTNAASFNIWSIIFLLLSIFQKEKVSIDEKNFEYRSRAEKDFNAFGTVVIISQSEHDVVFSARINGPRFCNFQYRSRKVVYIFQFKQDDCWWSTCVNS